MATSIVSPNAVGATVATTYASQSGWATKEDWIRHQALIEHLYRKQTLAKTIDFMTSRYGFKATENMYKKRINQWGLDKKNKAKEMRAIARKHRQLGDQGKLTTFRVRGRVIDYKDVVRYWERKGVRIDDVIAQRAKSKTPEAVDCFISLRSPTMTPEPMTNPERILISIRDYHKGSFEIKNVIVRCSESLGDHFENFVGPMNGSTLIIRLRNLHLLSSEHDMSQESIWLQDLLPWHYLATLDYVEALKLGWDMISRAQRFETLPFRSSVYADGLFVVANSQYAMGETYSAEVHLREAIDIRLSEFGPHDDLARDLLIHLENWLVQQGQLSSAAQVQKRWKDALPDSIDDG
ncbi:MAG: hypothetical protein Q9175_007613 [Cornicularia normoerica]